MDLLLSVCLGIGLAAACGFRVFVPLLLIGIAGRTEHLVLAGGMEWMASAPAILCFFIATVLEVAAYYVPWLDNLLDTLASPAAVIAGAVATASVVQEMSPFMRWTLALIAGGGIACLIQGATVGLRTASTSTTAGITNFLISTLELVMSLAVSLLSMALPILTALAIALLVGIALRIVASRRSAGRQRLGKQTGGKLADEISGKG
jgi:uncharacterized protein DUF4126